MNKFFKIEERNTTIKKEIIGGLITFLSMAYILVVNPTILSQAGMDQNAVFVTTAVASAFGCIFMGLYANYPVMIAPGMGMNAFLTYTVVISMGYSWQEGLFGIFIAGLLFLTLSITGIREKIINAIPETLKHALGAGIGFFIAFLGLNSIGLIVSNPDTLVSLGDLSNPITLLGVIGLIIVLLLVSREVKGAIFIGMIITTIIGIIMFLCGIDMGITLPHQIVSSPPSISPVFLKAVTDTEPLKLLLDPSFWIVIISLLFVDFFDTTATLLSAAEEAELKNEDGTLVDAKKSLLVDATTTTLGSLLGTSSMSTYVESIIGIKAGARTGLSALVAGLLFILAIFLSPLLAIVGPYVTAPALIVVGIMMSSHLAKIDYTEFANTASAFMTVIMIILTYSISEGISAGFITYVICKIGQGDYKKVHPMMYILAIAFFGHYFL